MSDHTEQLVNEEAKEHSTIKCPQCGSNLSYNPETMSLYCEHCEYIKKIDSEETEELSFDQIVTDNSWANETQVLQCNNCGAREVVSKSNLSNDCPYCGSPMVVDKSVIPGQKPNGVCPFLISKEKAFDQVKAWAHKKWMAPNDFRKNPDPKKMKGLYYPSFTYDAQTHSWYRGVLGKYYTVTRTVNGKTTTERRIRYFNIFGELPKFFDDVLIQASNSISQNNMIKILPYKTNEAKKYNSDYLQGFSADQYSKNGKECWVEAKKVISNDIRKSVLSRYTYDVVQSLNISTNYSSMTHKYVLLPLWVGHFLYHNKTYNYFLNGESGKMTGKSPVSVLKVLGIIGIALVIVAVILLVAFLTE